MRVLGTCSLCGGPVTVPDVWGGILPPVPCCQSCGAVRKQPHGPVIDMERPINKDLISRFQRLSEDQRRNVERRIRDDVRYRVAVEDFWRGDGWKPDV